MDESPLILLAGDNRLTQRVCAELCATTGHRVRVLWAMDAQRREIFEAIGAEVVALAADSDDALLAAGAAEATSILTLSADDGLNLSVALRARVLNPRLRLVVRQFDTLLGRKLEENLGNCTVLSLSAHAAATYAGAALDRTCLFAMRFPENDGPLMGFTRHRAAGIGVGNATVAEAEQRLRARIVAVNDREDPPEDALLTSDDRVTLFGRITDVRSGTREAAPAHERDRTAVAASPAGRLLGAYGRTNPILRILAVSAFGFVLLSLIFFHFALGKTWTAAAFYVTETMTNVGYGEVDLVTKRGPLVTVAAMAAMLGGIVFTSIFIGYVSSAVTRAQWTAMQGLRRIHARDHVVICGAGKVGTAVMNLLTEYGKRVVLVEPHPGADLVRRAREPDVDLLTGDARGDGALEFCDLQHATALLALSDGDAANLEVALGARARVPGIPLVVRMEDPEFANATAQLLGISTFSPSALGAPAFAGLARFPGTRGRVHYGGDEHTIGQRTQGDVPERPPARDCTALCVARRGAVQLIRTFDQMQPHDVVLFSVPLAQFRATPSAPRDVADDAVDG